MILTYRLVSFDHVKGIVKLFFLFLLRSRCRRMLENRIGRNYFFNVSVIQCERRYTTFASKLLQIPTKFIISTNCNLQQKALYYRL